MQSAFLHAAHIASDFTRVYCAETGTIFGTTYVYELDFSYLSISIFSPYYTYELTGSIIDEH